MSKRKGLLAVIGILVLLLSLSGAMMQCAPAAEEEVTPPPEEEVAPPPEEEIKYGGRLNAGWSIGQLLDTLRCDSGWQYVDMGCMFWQMVYDQLWMMGPGPDYEPLPRLATSWETEDRKTWTYHLRHDAVFHDGVPVTAEDVAFTLEYLPKLPEWHSAHRLCESISVIDDYTIEITLKTVIGEAKYPAVFWTPILPKHIWEPYKDDLTSYPNDEAIGSGPFKLKEFKPGQFLWFQANEDYSGGRPYVDEVVWAAYGSGDALYMAMETGKIDMMGYGGCSPLVADDFRGLENVDVVVSPSQTEWMLAFNLHKDTPLKDLNVRKAITHGIDRDAIIDLAYVGYAEKIDSFIYPEIAEHNPNLPQYDYNPDLAKNILNEGGYVDTDGDGIRNNPATGKNLAFDLLVSSDYTDEIKAISMIKEQLRYIGVEIAMEAMDESTYETYMFAPTDELWDIGMLWATPGPKGDWIWEYARSYPEGEGWNSAYYNNPEFDEALDKMLAEQDLMKRKEYLYQMQMMIAEDLPYSYLWRIRTVDPVRTDKFEGWVVGMGGVSSWFNPWTFYEAHLK